MIERLRGLATGPALLGAVHFDPQRIGLSPTVGPVAGVPLVELAAKAQRLLDLAGERAPRESPIEEAAGVGALREVAEDKTHFVGQPRSFGTLVPIGHYAVSGDSDPPRGERHTARE